VVVLCVLLAAGMALRVLLAKTMWMRPDADVTTAMEMALRASQGHPVLVFSGQNYGGALLSWIEAPLIAVFGFHMSLFWVVDNLLALLGAVALWGVARSFVKPMAAAASGGLFLFFSPHWVLYSSQENLFYLPGTVLGIVTAWLILRWFRNRSWSTAVAIGLSAGLAVWCTSLTTCLLLPAGIAFAWGTRQRLGHLAAAAAGFAIGVFPWVAVFAFGHKPFRSFGAHQHDVTVIRESVAWLIPLALGLGSSRRSQELFGWLVFLGATACLVVFLTLRRYELACCAASVVLWPFVVVLLRVPVNEGPWRYAFPMVPALIIVVSHLASLLRLSVLLAVAAFVSVFDVASVQTRRFSPAPACPASYSELGSYLEDRGRTAVWGSYWVASPLAICDYPHLAVGVADEKGDSRWAHAAAAAPQSTYVVYSGHAMDFEIADWARRHDVRALRRNVAGYAVWLLSERASPRSLGLIGAY
jgi:hypothetical protein